MGRPDELPDEALVARIQEGDEQALEILTDRYMAKLRPRIERRLRAGMRRKVAASDILQEANLVALQSFEAFEDRGPGSFARWFGKIVEMKIRESVRHYVGTAKRGIGRERSLQGAPIVSPGRSPSPSQVFAERELAKRASEALAALPPQHREVLRLLQARRLSLAEAAEVMGRTQEATRKLYSRALTRLEALMADRAE